MWGQAIWPVTLESGDLVLRPIKLRDKAEWTRVRNRNSAWLQPWEASNPAGQGEPPTYPGMVRVLNRQAREASALPFIITELRLTALDRSSGGTDWEMSAEKAGLMRLLVQPLSSDSTATAGTVSRPVKASSVSTSASTAYTSEPAASHLRRSNRSASAPPTGESSTAGRKARAAMPPVASARPVTVVTKTPSASVSIHVPMLETSAPHQT